MEKLIIARNIHKKLGDVNILKNIALEINSGEIIAIVGPSGAGKTTLLQILGTLSTPDSGSDVSLQIDKTNILNLKENELSELLESEIVRGRTTPGANQKNDVKVIRYNK